MVLGVRFVFAVVVPRGRVGARPQSDGPPDEDDECRDASPSECRPEYAEPAAVVCRNDREANGEASRPRRDPGEERNAQRSQEQGEQRADRFFLPPSSQAGRPHEGRHQENPQWDEDAGHPDGKEQAATR